MFYEALLLVAVLAVIYLLPLAVIASSSGQVPPDALLWGYLVVVMGVYFVWQWRQGQTLAMRTWAIEVVGSSGSRASWRRLLMRYALAWPSIGLLGVGLFWALFDHDRQFLHDRLADTRLVRVIVA